MAGASEVADSAHQMVSQLETVADAFETGAMARLSAMRNLGPDWDSLLAGLGAHQLSPLSLALICIGALAVAQLCVRAALFLFNRRLAGVTGWRKGLALLASLLVALLVLLLLSRLAIDDPALRTVARFCALGSLVFDLARAGLRYTLLEHESSEDAGAAAAQALVRSLTFAVGYALFGITLITTSRSFGAGNGLRDLVAVAVMALPLTALVVLAYWRHRKTVSALILAPHPDSRLRQKLAAMWPSVAIAVTLVSFVGLEYAYTIGRPLPAFAVLVTMLLVLLAPHLDTVAADWAERGLESPDITVLRVALRRTVRFLIAVVIASLLLFQWVEPVFGAFGFATPAIGTGVAKLGLILLLSAFLWNATGAFAGRVAQAQQPTAAARDDNGEEPRSRLATILPLVVGTSKAAILSMAILSMMITLGIDVLPIIGGLSVFGLAIGFGSQALVKDIVAGLFFLTDDAFRFGEYIETEGSKGTVEKISIRSLSLRNPRGAVATVPYGQIGKVTNFSRGWVIEKYVFRVAFDTDVDLVRRLFKKIGQDIAADPELSKDLLEPFKSQGIGMVEDGTLVIRGKFMARAGHQFAIKKAVLAAVQKAFRENGIKAIAKPFT